MCTRKFGIEDFGPKIRFCRSGLLKVRLSEWISLKRDLGRRLLEHLAWLSLGARLSEIQQHNTVLEFSCGSLVSSEARFLQSFLKL